jgi:mannose-6-phosphate isomerase-like protein (cupin superfamily)
MMALADGAPASVIAADGMLVDRPGFRVELLREGSIPADSFVTSRHEVLMVMRGHWRVEWDGGGASLGPGDVCAIPPKQIVSLAPAMSGEASLFRVTATDDTAGPTTEFHELPAVLARGRA